MKISEYFNSTLTKSLATVDENGQPNVCLCGTANMPDENTIHIGCIFIDQSRKNIRKTRKATFLASTPVDSDYWKHYEKTGEKLHPAGFRYYCTLIDETRDPEILKPIYIKLEVDPGHNIADKLDSVMIFKVHNVREIHF